MILELLIVFLIGILVFTLQIYIGKRWAVTLSVLFVAGVGWFVWHNETYMTVEEDFDSIYAEDHRVDLLEVTIMESYERFEVKEKSAIEAVLSDLEDMEGKKAERLNPEEYDYDLRFRVEKPMENGDTIQNYHSMFVNEEFISDYEIIDGEGHLKTVRELEAEAKE